jgi:flagellar protein FlaG
MEITQLESHVTTSESVQIKTLFNKNGSIDNAETEKIVDVKKNQSVQLPLDSVKEISKELNRHMENLETSLGFFIREGSDHQVVVEIKSKKTGKLIRQFPSEELLTIREKMTELTGLLFDQIL